MRKLETIGSELPQNKSHIPKCVGPIRPAFRGNGAMVQCNIHEIHRGVSDLHHTIAYKDEFF